MVEQKDTSKSLDFEAFVKKKREVCLGYCGRVNLENSPPTPNGIFPLKELLYSYCRVDPRYSVYIDRLLTHLYVTIAICIFVLRLQWQDAYPNYEFATSHAHSLL